MAEPRSAWLGKADLEMTAHAGRFGVSKEGGKDPVAGATAFS